MKGFYLEERIFSPQEAAVYTMGATVDLRIYEDSGNRTDCDESLFWLEMF